MKAYFKICLFICKLLILVSSEEDTDPIPNGYHNVCIIGGGVSGLVTARYLQKYGVEDVKIFEATTEIGGAWKFDPRVGIDEYGVPIFSSMYEDLRTNTARQTMELAGFPFPDGTPSYPTGQCFLKYLRFFAKSYNLVDFIQSYVKSVKREDNLWSITYLNTDSKILYKEYCNQVVLGTGRESKPKLPKIFGMETFRGRIFHSHEYKFPAHFAGRRVLLMGAGPSGLDLSVQLDNYTSKLIHSHHRAGPLTDLRISRNYIKKPDVVNIVHNGAYFEDGSFEEIDDIIFCTGYELDHQYLDDSCGILTTGSQVIPLYNQVVNIRHPTMYFLGLLKSKGIALFDNQAEYIARKIAGLFSLPSRDVMLDNWLNYQQEMSNVGKRKTTKQMFLKFQDDYFANMTLESGMAVAPPVISAIRDFNLQVRVEDVPHYRQYEIQVIDDYNFIRYRSPYRGDECPLEHYI